MKSLDVDETELLAKHASGSTQAEQYAELNPREQAEILHLQQQILALVSAGHDCKSICAKLCLLEERLSPNAVASVMLLDPSAGCLDVYVAPSVPSDLLNNLKGLVPGPGAGSCGNAVFSGQPVFVENTLVDERWQNLRGVAEQLNIRACWSMPILGKGGRIIGSFALSNFDHGAPSSFQRKLLEIGAFIVGIVYEHDQVQQQLRLADKVFEQSTEGMMITDADNRIVSVNRAFTSITGYASDEVIGQTPSILSSYCHNRAFYEAMWCSIHETGHWQGEIWNKKRDGHIYPEWLSITAIHNGDATVSHYLGVFTDLSDKKHTDALIWHQANFDRLTGLPNRSRFYDRLEQDIKTAARENGRLALLSIDLDRFKEVNDAVGHYTGDELLKYAASRLENCVRATDLVARVGGDEFGFIVNNVGELDSVDALARLILSKLSQPFDLGGKLAYVSASIGISLYPDDADNIDALIRYADHAMYAAKSEGRNRWRYFTSAMQQQVEKRCQTVQALRRALTPPVQFQLLYQPIVELATERVRKAEALVRWRHPELGLISPADFIPIAEETRLILGLGDWVFRQAAEQAVEWQARYGQDFQISINKSPVQFHDKEATDWMAYLAQLGIAGNSLVIEITESLLLDVSEKVSKTLLDYRDAGVQVAMDDFGTGYSSLSYLKKFDIDYLKIDQSFVRNLGPDSDDRVLCEAMITMAHRLGMKVIAEGVETPLQRELLLNAGCDYAQGFLFAKPLSVPAFDMFMEEDR